jgi:hypothetical protein
MAGVATASQRHAGVVRSVRMLCVLALLALGQQAWAQQYLGTPGLIHAPSAEMDTAGVARLGAQYIPVAMMPDAFKFEGEKYASWTNYVSITPFRWVEVGYGYTLMKFHKNRKPDAKVGFYSKDRYLTLRLQPLREGKYWPSVVVGGNDVYGSGDEGFSGSNYYRNFYVAATKHFKLGGNLLGTHLAYRWWKRDYNDKWAGVTAGLTFRPAFYSKLRFVAEWDGNEANVGVDCLLFKYFMLQCALYDYSNFTAGLSLYIPLLK